MTCSVKHITTIHKYVCLGYRWPKEVSLWTGVNRRWASVYPESFIGIKTPLNPSLQPVQLTSTGSQKEGFTKNNYKMNVVNVEFQWHLANLTSVVGPLIYKRTWGGSWVLNDVVMQIQHEKAASLRSFIHIYLGLSPNSRISWKSEGEVKVTAPFFFWNR